MGKKVTKRSPTLKQQAVAGSIARGDLSKMTKGEILECSGYSLNTSRVATAEIFSSEGVKKSLIAQGFDLEQLTKPAIDALKAKKGSFFKGQYFETDKPDHIVRLKGLDALADITGMKKLVVEGRSLNVNVDYSEIAGVF